MSEVPKKNPDSQNKPTPYPDFLNRVKETPNDDFEKAIEQRTNAISTSNEVQLLSTGPDAFKQLEQEIQQAKTSIDINMFSWADDATGLRMAKLILDAANKNPNLKITIRLDKLGTLLIGGKNKLKEKENSLLYKAEVASIFLEPQFNLLTLRKLKSLQADPNSLHSWTFEEKTQLNEFVKRIATNELLMEVNPVVKMLSGKNNIKLIVEENSLATIDHSKVFVFDDKTAYSGGMNIGDEYSGGYDEKAGWNGKEGKYWKDYMMKMTGPASTIHKHHFFPEQTATGDKLLSSPTHSRTMVLHNEGGPPPQNPDEYAKRKQISYAAGYLIEHAQKKLDIEHAYIMSDFIVQKLKEAAARGVKITILRSQPESPGHETSNQKYFSKLAGFPNINIIPHYTITHTKLMIADDNYSLIGSANLTQESLDYHEEAGILVIGDSPFQKQVKAQFERSLQYAKQRAGITAATVQKAKDQTFLA